MKISSGIRDLLEIFSGIREWLRKWSLPGSGIFGKMQCVVTCFLIRHNESYVEGIGSILKQYNPSNRNISLDHLEEEVIVAWNGPDIPHCDNIVKDTINTMHGVGQWHFVRKSAA